MPLKPEHPKASRYQPPPQSSSVRDDKLNIPFARTLDIEVHDEEIARALKEVTTFYAVDETPLEVLQERFGTCARWGKERRWLWLASAASEPQNLCYWATVIKFPDGRRRTVLPQRFLPDLLIDQQLDREIRRQLGCTTEIGLMRRTGLSRRRIRKICEALVEENLEELRNSDFAPLFLAIDLVDLNGGQGKELPVLVVAASDPREGKRRFLGIFVMPKGRKKWTPQTPLVRQLKELILALPHSEDLLGVAIDGETRLHNLMSAVRRTLALQNPDFNQLRFVLDRWHVIFNAAKALAALRRSLRNEDPDDKAINLALMNASKLPEGEHWMSVEADPEMLKEANRLFRRFPELKDLHAIVTQVRDLFMLEDRISAEAAFDGLCESLTELQRRRLEKFIKYVNDRREAFLAYFDLKEETQRRYGKAYSVTGGLVEAMNGQAKLRNVAAPNTPLMVLHAQMISAYGQATAAAREEFESKRQAERAQKAKLKQEAEAEQRRRQREAAARQEQEDLAADAEFLRTMTLGTTASRSGSAPSSPT